MVSRLRSTERFSDTLPFQSPTVSTPYSGEEEAEDDGPGRRDADTPRYHGAGGLVNQMRRLFRRVPMKWVLRVLFVVVICQVVLQYLQLTPRSLGLIRQSQCTRYDPLNAPGEYHLWGLSFNSSVVPAGAYAGEGVVMAASGAITRQAVGAWVTAFTLRSVLHCELPITIYYSGEAEQFHGPVLAALQNLTPPVTLRNLLTSLEAEADRRPELPRHLMLPSDPSVLRSYAAKVYALAASPYQHNILLDAGAVPFVSPTVMMARLASYRVHGLAIFSDYVALDRRQWAHVMRMLCVDWSAVQQAFGGRELDSSCVLIDKSRNVDALLVALSLNGELQKETYSHLIGDKDTFGLAMLHVGKTFSVQNQEPGYLLLERERTKARKVSGHLQFLRDPTQPHGLLPIHHNNQLLDFREFPVIVNRTYMEVFSELGDVLMPVNRRRDCRPFHPRTLKPLTPAMADAYMRIAEGLKAAGLDHCACRDDWISCEQDNARRRAKVWIYGVIDWLGPRHKPRGYIDPMPPGTLL